MELLEPTLSGFWLGLTLIVAIGAQNAFVLQQGLRKHHVFWVCLTCAASDAILIAVGVSGFGAMVTSYPSIETVARYGGAIFLVAYGARSLFAALFTRHTLKAAGDTSANLRNTVAMCLAFTWLNPHVYLDTVVLLGAVSTQYDAGTRWFFGAGAMLASFLFFFSLGYGARFLEPLFRRPASWRILDFGIALIMFAIALSLVWAPLSRGFTG